jgi:hypothetical protein
LSTQALLRNLDAMSLKSLAIEGIGCVSSAHLSCSNAVHSSASNGHAEGDEKASREAVSSAVNHASDDKLDATPMVAYVQVNREEGTT